MSNSRKSDTVDGAHVGLFVVRFFPSSGLQSSASGLSRCPSLRVGLHGLNDSFHSQGPRAFDEYDVAGEDRLAQVGQCFFGCAAYQRMAGG